MSATPLRQVERRSMNDGEPTVSPASKEQSHMTKEPLYKLWMGLWHAYLPGESFHVLCGLGYTKEAAYADWQRMREKYAS